MVEEPIAPPDNQAGLVPETIIIEANRTISELDNPGLNTKNHEWETLLAEPLHIKRGDEVRVSNVFANQVGADSGVISFNDANTNLQNNKTRIIYSFYACDDGTNGKRKVIDMLGKGALGFFKEFNTYNDMPLYRFQNNGLEFTYSDFTDPTLGQFFGSGAEAKGLIDYRNFWNDNQANTEKLIAPYEDRYLPGVFYNNIFLRTQNATSSAGNYWKMDLDINMSGIRIHNNTGTLDITRFIQPGMIINITTDSAAFGTPSPLLQKQFWDDFYFVQEINTNNYISLNNVSPRTRGGQNWLNVINTEEGHTSTIGQTTLKFNADPLIGTAVQVGTYVTDVALGISTKFAKNTTVTNISSAASIPHNFTAAYGLGTSGQNKWRVTDITGAEINYFAANAAIFGSTNSRVTALTPDPTLNFPTLIPYATAFSGAVEADFVDNHNENYSYYKLSDNTPDTTLYVRSDFSNTDSNYVVGTGTFANATAIDYSVGENFTNFLYVLDITNVKETEPTKYLITNQTPDATNPQYNNLPFVTSSKQISQTLNLLLSPNNFVNGITVKIKDVNGNSGIKEVFRSGGGNSIYNIELMTVTKHSGVGTVPVDTIVTSCYGAPDPDGNTIYTLQLNKIISGVTPTGTILSFQNTYGANSGYLIFNRNLNQPDSVTDLIFTTEDGQFDAGYTSLGMTLFDNSKTNFATISTFIWNKANRNYEFGTSAPLGITGTAGTTQLLLQSNMFGIDGSGNKNTSFVSSQVNRTEGGNNIARIGFETAITQSIFAPNNKLVLTASKQTPNSGTITMSENLIANINPGDTVTLNQNDKTVTISNALIGQVNPDTPIYFTPIPSSSSDPITLDYHLRISPKGYNFTPTQTPETSGGTFYGMYGYTEEKRPKVGDRYKQYAVNRLDSASNSLETNIKRINKDKNLPVQSAIILEEPITNLFASGTTYNENSVVNAGTAKLLLFDDKGDGSVDITVNVANITDFNQPGNTGILSAANPSTNIIFNIQRGVAIRLTNIATGDIEYIRIPNGCNQGTWSNSTLTYVNTNEFTLKGGVRRYFEGGINETGQYDPSTAIDWNALRLSNNNKIKIDFINLITSYNEWTGKTNSPVNTLALQGNATVAPYTFGQSFIMIKDDIEEDTFINSNNNQYPVGNGHFSTYPISNDLTVGSYFYTGGYSRGLATNYYNTSNPNPRLKGSWVLHREFADIDLSAGGTNLSPSDIANLITEQTHNVRKAKINVSIDQKLNGFDFPESRAFGLPNNRFYIPIVTQPYDETLKTPTNNLDGISFKNYASHTNPLISIDGSFRFHNFYYNYKLIDAIDLPSGNDQQPGFPNGGTLAANSLIDAKMLPVYPRSTDSYVLTNDIFSAGTQANREYPVLLHGSTGDYAVSMSQFVGSNNVTAGFSANFNRIALSYLHQPYISAAIVSGTGAAKITVGGQQSVRYFYPYKTNQYDKTKPIGRPYWDRFGGVNFECYAGNFIQQGNSYFDTIDQTNPLLKENYDTRNLSELNPIGRRFWNKLGFSDNQLITKIGSTYSVSDTEGYLILNGTTGQNIDVASGYISDVPTATSSASLFSYPGTTGNTSIPSGTNVWTQLTSVGGLSGLDNTGSGATFATNVRNSAHTGYNAPDTSGEPLLFDSTTNTGNQDNLKWTSLTGAALPPDNGGSPPVPTPIEDNPFNDYIGNFGFTIDAESDLLKADNLPVKTINSYYLLFCKELGGSNNFYTTSNRGNLAPECMALVSRLNTQSDFYFSYQSPISFFAKSDMIISRITTRILNADLSVPTTLGANSSVIYQIIRFNPKPPVIQPTLTQLQDNFIGTMAELDKQQRASKKQGLSNIQQIMDSITEAALTPDDNQSDLITSIIERANRLNILNVSPGERRRILQEDPEANDLLNEIEELQNAREGVFSGVGALSQIVGTLGDPEEPQPSSIGEGGGIMIQPTDISEDLNNQLIQEAFDRRLAERNEVRSGIQNVRERVERLGEIQENPLVKEYAGRRGLEARVALGGFRRGIPEDADIRRRRIEFPLNPTERIPQGVELNIDTEGNIRRARQRARARVTRSQEEQQRELQEDREVMRQRREARVYNPFSTNPEERVEVQPGERVRINPRRVREARQQRQDEAVRTLRQQTPEPEERKE